MRILQDMLNAVKAARLAKGLWDDVFGPKLPPHVVRDNEGKVWPEAGYWWVHPEDPNCLGVVWTPGRPHGTLPHVVASHTEQQWCAEAGWHWSSTTANDYRVERDAVPANLSPEAIQRIKDFGVLGLDAEGSASDIENAFRELAKVHHPDRFAGQGERVMAEAQQRFVRLRGARDRLMAGGRS